MKDNKENQKEETDKYGKITLGKASKLLIDIIGQNVILDFVKPEKDRQAYEIEIQRIYNGEMDYHYFDRLQCYSEKFLRKIESDYDISPLVRTSLLDTNLKAFIWDFSLYAESHKTLEYSKNEIALFLLHQQALHYISDDSSEKDLLSDLAINAFKTSEEKILIFLTDSYEKIFYEIMRLFKNNEIFYKEIKYYCGKNSMKYPKLFEKELKVTTKESTEIDTKYKININNWCNDKVYNANWKTLVPVLDCLLKQKHISEKERISFVHRLIGLYLRKNAQKAFSDILGVTEDEMRKTIEEIVDMIKEKKRPEKIPIDIDFPDIWGIWFNDQRLKIIKCLKFQNNFENSNDVTEANKITKYLKLNYSRSSEEKFLYFWLQTRAKIFQNHSDLKDHKEVRDEILKGYRKAIEALIKEGGKSTFLTQFFMEIILINISFYPRRIKAINNYYEYCRTLEIFSGDREKLLDNVKEFKSPDIRIALVNIYSRFCPIKLNL